MRRHRLIAWVGLQRPTSKRFRCRRYSTRFAACRYLLRQAQRK